MRIDQPQLGDRSGNLDLVIDVKVGDAVVGRGRVAANSQSRVTASARCDRFMGADYTFIGQSSCVS